jgi:predicted PurR-regulated permease PerM
MTTKYLTAIGVLVLAIVFGFIFVTQFTNQPSTINNVAETPSPAATPPSQKAPDSVDSIEKDLNSVDVNGIDSDSSQFTSEVQGF